MKIKTSRYYKTLKCLKKKKKKKKQYQLLLRMSSNWNLHTLLMGIQNGLPLWKTFCQCLKKVSIHILYMIQQSQCSLCTQKKWTQTSIQSLIWMSTVAFTHDVQINDHQLANGYPMRNYLALKRIKTCKCMQ